MLVVRSKATDVFGFVIFAAEVLTRKNPLGEQKIKVFMLPGAGHGVSNIHASVSTFIVVFQPPKL